MKALFVAADGFEDIEFNATRDVLVRAGIDCTVVSGRLSPKAEPILGKTGSEIVTYREIDDVDWKSFDLFVIPGGPHYQTLEKNEAVLAMAKWFASQPEKYLAAICAAPTILGHLGLLKGRDYTCFPTMNEDFGGRFHQQYAVIDGHLITGDGPAAPIAFGLAIVKAALGLSAAKAVAGGMFYEGKL